MDNLRGIFPATVSTFDMDGKFDPVSMRRIVRHQIDAGVHGLYVCGGTGEGLLMNSKERQDLLETVLDETRGDVTVIAHVGAFQIPESIALAQHASGIGVDAISALPPSYFYKPDEISQINYSTYIYDVTFKLWTIISLLFTIMKETIDDNWDEVDQEIEKFKELVLELETNKVNINNDAKNIITSIKSRDNITIINSIRIMIRTYVYILLF